MPINFLAKPTGQDSAITQQLSVDQARNTQQRFEKLKAMSYGTLGVITTLALSTFVMLAIFLGAKAFFTATAIGKAISGVSWLDYTLFTTMGIGPLLTLYPITKIAGPIFAKAQVHWK